MHSSDDKGVRMICVLGSVYDIDDDEQMVNKSISRDNNESSTQLFT